MIGYAWYDKVNDELLNDEEARELCQLCFEELGAGYHYESCGQEIGNCETLQLLDLKHFFKENPQIFKELTEYIN
ncbi:MAG: hypothetical protein ACI4EY_08920 [Lachnospiraceae bacterium]